MILKHHFPRNVWEWCLFIIKKEYGGKRMKLKKVLSMALSLAMIMSIVPGNVFAADLDADVAVEDFSDDVTVGVEENVVSEESEIIEEDSDQAAEVDFQEENDDIRQDFAQEVSNDDIALFSDGVVKESEEENIVASGTLNEGVYAVSWKLYEDGNLIFSGNGSINGYSKYNAPWYQYRQKINRIIIEDGIKEIGNGDFYGCNNVNEVIIGKSVRNIEFDAFRECINLKRVTFSDSLKQICDSAFRNCSSLVSIEIPESVITIQNYAFSGCKNLSKVELHEGLTSLGENAFNDCSSLEKIKIPNGVHGLSKQIFYNCAKLTSIILPKSITYIEFEAFGGCSSLTEIQIPNGVGSIRGYAFSECKKLSKLEIPESVTYIEDGAFDGCDGLEIVELPKSCKKISKWSFTNCNNLKIIRYVGTENEWSELGININNDKVKVYCNYVAQHTHVYEKEIISNPTCETVGYAKETCKLCGESYTENIKATGHAWDAGKITKDASCEETGVKTYTCTSCKATKTENIKALGHKEVKDATVEATCEKDGLTEGSHCSVCNKVITEQKKIPATGHAWDAGKVTKEATCEEAGVKTYTCTSCKATKTEDIKALGHKEVKDAAVEATCEKDGLTEGSHCSVCNKVLVAQNVVKALGHKEVKDAAVEATCEKDGLTEGSHCSVCNKVITEQKKIPATGHAWDAGKVTKEATCEEAGVKTYTCTSCKATKTEDIKALGHKEVKDAAVEATCEKDGLTEGSHCSVCNKVITEQKKIPATGHEFSSWKTISQATVFSPEKQSHSCSACGKSEQREVGSALQKTIRVSATSLPLKTKQKTTALRVSGLAAGDSIVSWKSNNTKVVRVYGRANGTSTIKAGSKKGKAKITITLKSGLKKVVTVTVQKTAVKTKKITGAAKNLKLKRKQKAVLRPVLAPVTSKQKITYKSSNTKVATVNSKGQITAKKKGTAVITVKSGSKTVKCKVTVR